MRIRAILILWGLGLSAPVASFLLLDALFPFPFERLQRPAARIVTDRFDEPLRFFLATDGQWRFPVELDELPPELVDAVVASEDRWFYHHPGVNPLSVIRATWQNWKEDRVVSGGSTIPMQIVRMVDPAPRTLRVKAREAFRALQLDRRRSKRELLVIYFNLLPYGGNIEGVGAASYFYFGKEPRRLSVGEIGLLAVLPRSPSYYDPTRHPQRVRRARDRVLAQLGARDVFSPGQVEAGRRQPVPTRRARAPFEAPHFARLAAETMARQPRIRTSIDRALQSSAEAQVARRIGGLRRQGIGNAAVVVVENETRALRAMVGSAGFFDPAHDGQVNGALARRSPGSTLKPFLYALALDRGEVLVDSYLLDVPTDFAGYVAKNYDGRYRGRVTVREALRQSLNAPAVRLLARTGLRPFHQLLRRAGLHGLDRPTGSYGLPLVLGAGEVSLLELTGAYVALARGGTPGAVRWLDGRILGRSRPLFSREVAWMVTQILTEVRRPDLPAAWDLTREAPAVAWKTGTSYGHRDAWAVGFSQRFTIGVWVGNFDGSPRQGISGSEHAAPLLFDLFRALERKGGGPRRPVGLELESLEVCALSHQLPGPYCPARQRVTHIRGRSRLETCAYHRRQRIAESPGHGGSYRTSVRYPQELVSWWRSQGQPLPATQGDFSTGGAPAGEPPRIVSPDVATPYRLRSSAPLEYQQIPLIAQTGQDSRHLYWYRDGTLVANGAPGETLFLAPERGKHRIVVTDDQGLSDSLSYRVE